MRAGPRAEPPPHSLPRSTFASARREAAEPSARTAALDLSSANLSNVGMNFCADCGGRVSVRTPAGDHLPRYICDQCGAVHYENPRIVAGCVPELDGRILLCKRGIEPRLGYWTVPAGFMENGETLQQAAARESREEALVSVDIGSLLSIVHVLPAHQVHVFFRARLRDHEFGVGPESLEVELVDPADIPWSDIAFPSTEFTLRRYLEDRASGREPYHFAELTRRFAGAVD